ncbi:MAG TPA: hypothetical protein VHC90_19055 [Bryobacteraceae bacterium]|nr:hypothetical protein [Bryobacteraceae bacterium]
MALADLGRALTGQALDTAKSSMLDALQGAPAKPASTPAPAAAPAPPSTADNTGAVIVGQLQAMQKSLKDDQELVVQLRAGDDMMRVTEIFIPSPQVLVLTGADSQRRLTRIVSAAATLQLICKVLPVTPGAQPLRLRILTPAPPAPKK